MSAWLGQGSRYYTAENDRSNLDSVFVGCSCFKRVTFFRGASKAVFLYLGVYLQLRIKKNLKKKNKTDEIVQQFRSSTLKEL